MESDSEKKDQIQWHVAAFLDLLGQSAILEKIKNLPNPENQDEVGAFLKLIRQSFGLVETLNDSFKTQISAMGEETPLAKSLPKEQRDKLRSIHSRPIKLQRFSDGVVVFASIAETDDSPSLVALNAVWSVLSSCATTFLTFLASGFPLRGGIELGVGLEYAEGELFGASVHRAYKLESTVAQYPRIVVGDELCNYLNTFEVRNAPNDASDFNKRLVIGAKRVAGECKKLVCRDIDGRMILDFMGDGVRTICMESEMGQIVHPAFDYVQNQLKKARKENDFKMASRYMLLHKYFEARLPSWPERNAS